MSSDERNELLETLGAEVRAYQNALDKADDAVAEVLGINRTDARCLDFVDQHERITPGQLGALTARMAAAGVNIEVLNSDHDHRLVLVVDDPAHAREVAAGWMAERERAA